MSSAARRAKTYTIEADINNYIIETKGDLSASQRVNDLLNAAIENEQLQSLERQAEKFFANPRNADRENTRAFQEAAMRVQARD